MLYSLFHPYLKGELAEQNYSKFEEYKNKFFNNINPYLIESNNCIEGSLFIDTSYNIYVLPRDLYKEKSVIKTNSILENFLITMTKNLQNHLNKKIILIRDECHIATKNLDSLIEKGYFIKVINFSATPKLTRGKHADVEISMESAENINLIKKIEYQNEKENLSKALEKFKVVKNQYLDLLGINPCMIIQISNKDKADEELNNIFRTLNKQHKDLKWMLIVDDEKKCDTNDTIKTKKLPVKKWKKHVKTDASVIDIIIFKMVISEGWDIPRACMLYQIRDTTSKQLDEQVIGRVRRNPILLNFEDYSIEAQNLASTAYIWGIKNKKDTVIQPIQLYGELHKNIIQKEISINTTIINDSKILTKTFQLPKLIEQQPKPVVYESIFKLYKKISKSNASVKKLYDKYVTSYDKWFKFANNIDIITNKTEEIICDYNNTMEICTDEKNKKIEYSIPFYSCFTKSTEHQLDIDNWIWKLEDNSFNEFSFDSQAEYEWCKILNNLKSLNINGENIIKKIKIKSYKFNKDISLYGKNYIYNSQIKFQYSSNGIYNSYPDFIMKDYKNNIHIFEVKSVNKSSSINIDEEEYNKKVNILKECYKHSSRLLPYLFYLPIKKNDNWQIFLYKNYKEKIISLESFINSFDK